MPEDTPCLNYSDGPQNWTNSDCDLVGVTHNFHVDFPLRIKWGALGLQRGGNVLKRNEQ